MMFNWHDLRIDTRGRHSGNLKTTCPNCSPDRRNKTDRCLSVNLDSGLFLCHHCTWAGRAQVYGILRTMNYSPKKSYRKPNYGQEAATSKLITWFAERGISEQVV